MKRIRHCACKHLPEDAEHLRALLAPAELSVAALNSVVGILYAQPSGDRRHDRALRYVSAPDAHGHMRWTGPIPLNSGPRVQYQGSRMPAAHWMWLRAGRPPIFPLVRTCHDGQCISPEHHDLAAAQPEHRLVLMHAALADFDAHNPRINPRPKRWDHSDPTATRCLRAGHTLTIYGDPKIRNTYCSNCAYDERERLRARSALEAQIANYPEHFATRAPVDERPGPTSVDLDAIPDGPTLVDQLLAEGYLSA